MKILNLKIIKRLNRIKANPIYANKEREKLIEGKSYKSNNPKKNIYQRYNFRNITCIL